jgi:cytosine/uracil/thiamine/allantoin permease
MFGFVIASLVFDIFTRVVGYGNSLDKAVPSIISLVAFSTISAGVAGLIIASFFLEFPVALNVFAGLHAVGGFIGGTIGVVLVRALTARGVMPSRL